MKRLLLSLGLVLAFAGAASAQKAPAKAWSGPEVTLHTTMGDIVITLDAVGAPKTTRQFIGLVKGGHYDGHSFYRVEPGSLIQAGDLDANYDRHNATRGPVPLETATTSHVKGAVALAHGDDPNSGVSTFFIDLDDNPRFNDDPSAKPNTTGYTVFGHVTAGMDVVTKMSKVKRNPDGGSFPGKQPKEPIVITKAEVTKAQ